MEIRIHFERNIWFFIHVFPQFQNILIHNKITKSDVGIMVNSEAPFLKHFFF